jgi:hypothetical protein
MECGSRFNWGRDVVIPEGEGNGFGSRYMLNVPTDDVQFSFFTGKVKAAMFPECGHGIQYTPLPHRCVFDEYFVAIAGLGAHFRHPFRMMG